MEQVTGSTAALLVHECGAQPVAVRLATPRRRALAAQLVGSPISCLAAAFPCIPLLCNLMGCCVQRLT